MGEYAAGSQRGRTPTWPYSTMALSEQVTIEFEPLLKLAREEEPDEAATIEAMKAGRAYLRRAQSAAHSYAYISGKQFRTGMSADRWSLIVERIK